MTLRVTGIGSRGTAVLAATVLAVGAAVVPMNAAPAVASEPPSDQVVIDVVTVKGSGCRKETAEVSVSPDNEAFTVTYSGYLARVGIGAKKPDSRKNCQLNIRLSIPPGFTYAVARVDYQGFAFLEDGATAAERAKYRFQGSPERLFVEHRFTGPLDDTWLTTDIAEPGSMIFGPCGKARALRIDTELEVHAGSSDPDTTSLISMDATDGSVETTYHFAWRTCR